MCVSSYGSYHEYPPSKVRDTFLTNMQVYFSKWCIYTPKIREIDDSPVNGVLPPPRARAPLLATEPDTGDVVGLVAPSHMVAWPDMGSMAISMGKSSENHGEHPVWSWRFERKLPELEVIFGKIIEVLVFFQPWSWLPEGIVLSFVLVPCYVWLMRTSLADLTLEKDPKTATPFGYVFLFKFFAEFKRGEFCLN